MRPVVLGLAAKILAASRAVTAEEHPVEPPVVAELKTIRIEASQAERPAPGTVADLYPPDARAAGVQGSALLRCAIAAQGRFSNCRVVEEDPADQGFGGASLRASTAVRQPIPDPRGGLRKTGDVYLPFWFAIRERASAEIKPGKYRWVHVPTGEEMAAAYPLAAQYKGGQGSAVITCTVTAEGRLTRCQVTDESPHGAGFGRAALSLTDKFQLKSTGRDGRSLAGGQVRIPLLFRLPEG